MKRGAARRLPAPGVPRLLALALGLGGAAALHAAAVARDLNADGSLYLLVAASHRGLALIEPARKTAQVLQQAFSALAFRAGVSDLATLGRLLTLGMQGWPLVITGACWLVLPKREKGWILGPLLNLAVVIPTVGLRGIHEVIVASCLMWLLFLLLEFGDQGWVRPAAAVGVTAAGFALNETAFPFLAGIALLAAARARRAAGVRRVLLALVVPLAVAGAANALAWTLRPRDPANRGEFVRGALGGFLLAPGPHGVGVHLPALAALATGVCLLLPHLPRRWTEQRRLLALEWACGASLVLFAAVAVLFVFAADAVTLWDGFSAARVLPTAATTAMALATHVLRRAGWDPGRLAPAPVRTVLAGFVVMNLAVQTSLSVRWDAYRRDLAALVAERRGPVDSETARLRLDPGDSVFRGALVRSWSVQPLSIVLAPGGEVRAAVDPPPGAPWKPYRLDDPATLPLGARGLRWDAYLAALPPHPHAVRDGGPRVEPGRSP